MAYIFKSIAATQYIYLTLSKPLIAGKLLHLSLPRFQDIFNAMKSCLANILVQFVQFGWLLWQQI